MKRGALERFFRDTRAGATAITAAIVTVMTVVATALIIDHIWLVDQRDLLKSGANAAGVAATLEMARLVAKHPAMNDQELQPPLEDIARRYVLLNLSHLPSERFQRAQQTLVLTVEPDRADRVVKVTAQADLGGTLISRHMSLLGNYTGPESIRAGTQIERSVEPVEVVLAVDISQSMQRCLGGASGRCRDPNDARMAIVKRAAADLVEILNPGVDNQVAVGVAPWHMTVRLGPSRRDDWALNGWAKYPRSRHYAATYSCGRTSSCPAPAQDHTLPQMAPEAWHGCLDEHRLPAVGSHASLPGASNRLNPPVHEPFAQSFFPAPYGTAYQCADYPGPGALSLQFCYDEHRFAAGSWSERLRQQLQPPQYGCPATQPAMVPLTSDRETVDAAIAQLDAVGTLTYSALGLLWGTRLLDPDWKSVWGDAVHPVDPSATESARKALVLLTDGDDTYCDLGAGTKRSCEGSAAGVGRAQACEGAKAKGIEVFVIAAMEPGLVSEHLAETLRACSSESDNPDGRYVFLNNATPEALESAFADIANQLSTIRRVY